MAPPECQAVTERNGFRDLRHEPCVPFFASPICGEFLGNKCGRTRVYHRDRLQQEASIKWAQVAIADVRLRTGIDPLTAKTGVRVP